MPSYKDKNGTWYVSYFITNYKGEKQRKLKRGFKTKREAEQFLAKEKLIEHRDINMSFKDFVELYLEDKKKRIRSSTYQTKEAIIEKHIMPYFKYLKMNQIKAIDVVKWQNELLEYRDKNGKEYSPVFLKTIHNQLSAIFNYACKFYGLKTNPAREAGNVGKETNVEKDFWLEEEYLQFLKKVSNKEESYYAFEVLFYTGLRIGELLALTVEDIDFENKTLRVNKSCQRIKGKDVITPPKTKKSNRTVTLPNFLCEELAEYISHIYDAKPKTRLFPYTKSFFHHEIERGCKKSGVKKISLHEIRHSHITYCLAHGFSANEVADRVGHESIRITYNYAHLYQSKARAIANMFDESRKER